MRIILAIALLLPWGGIASADEYRVCRTVPAQPERWEIVSTTRLPCGTIITVEVLRPATPATRTCHTPQPVYHQPRVVWFVW